MLTELLLVTYTAVAPLDPPRAALLEVLTSSDDATGCERSKLRGLAADATIRKLGRVDRDDVILASVQSPCICGAQNCPYYAIRLTPGRPRVLLDTYAIDVRDADRAAPLPGLVVDAHDSAMVAAETRFAYRDGAYAATSSGRLRGSDRAYKPDDVPVRFAPGASAAQLSGKAAMGWYDAYAFTASKGQRLTIDGVRSHANVSLTLIGPKPGAPFETVRPGVPFTLRESGTYRLHVENDSESDVAYTITLAIR